MPKSFCLLAILLISISCVFAQQKSIQERLGYSKDTKLLIIHADDLGVSHAENMASITALEKGAVNSASILVPCPWFPEIAAYAKEHPQADLGLHLALTSEWKYLKWGPVAPADEVKGLVTREKFFYDNVPDVVSHASAEEVEKELRAQIARAISFGVDPTHFDTHMGTLGATPDFLKVYIKLGREYKVPVLLTREALPFTNENDVIMDQIAIASPEDYKTGMNQFYTRVLTSLQPGITCLILHAAYDNDEMQAVTADHIDYGAAWRQADFNFFMSEDCKKLLKQERIQLITWREVRDKLLRK